MTTVNSRYTNRICAVFAAELLQQYAKGTCTSILAVAGNVDDKLDAVGRQMLPEHRVVTIAGWKILLTHIVATGPQAKGQLQRHICCRMYCEYLLAENKYTDELMLLMLLSSMNLLFDEYPALLALRGKPPYAAVLCPVVAAAATRLLELHQPDIIVFGHSHKASSWQSKGVCYINPGSAGQADASAYVHIKKVKM